MYFWRINSLKRDLAARALHERDALPYLLWLGSITTFALSLPLGESNRWDAATAVLTTGLFLGGTCYTFHCNGGAGGAYFLVRYLAMNWVLGLRLLVLLGVPIIVGGILLEEILFEPVPPETTPVMAGLLVIFEAIFYWRLARHMRDVAAGSRAA
jgi:hypothetical protein